LRAPPLPSGEPAAVDAEVEVEVVRELDMPASKGTSRGGAASIRAAPVGDAVTLWVLPQLDLTATSCVPSRSWLGIALTQAQVIERTAPPVVSLLSGQVVCATAATGASRLAAEAWARGRR
jgi:hypothetical protein